MADVTFTGNLTAAPEMKFSNSGKAFANFTVAENYRKKNQNGEWEDSGTAFWRVTVFGYQAEAVADTLDKGMKVVVQGRGELREYTTKEGAQGKSLECVANHVGVVPRAPKNNNSGGGNFPAPAGFNAERHPLRTCRRCRFRPRSSPVRASDR